MDDKEFYNAYFQRSPEYYLTVLEKYATGQKFVFNPYALLTGLFWFLFRKLYKETMIVIAILIIWNTMENYYGLGKQVSLFFSIAISASYGVVANNLYMKKAIKQVEAAKVNFSNREDIIAYLSTKGGTTLHPVFIAIILFLLCIVLLNYLN